MYSIGYDYGTYNAYSGRSDTDVPFRFAGRLGERHGPTEEHSKHLPDLLLTRARGGAR